MGIVRPIGIKAGSCHLTVTDNSVIIAAQDCKRHFHVSLLLPVIHRKYYVFNKASIIAKGTVKILGLLLSVRCCNGPELPQIYFMSGSVQRPGKIRHRLCPIFGPVGYGYIRNKLQYPVSRVLLYRSNKPVESAGVFSEKGAKESGIYVDKAFTLIDKMKEN